MTKQELRQHLLQERRGIAAETKAFWDMLVFERAHKQRAFQRAERVHVFRSTAEEIDTMKFVEYAWGTGKEVYVPVVDTPTTRLIHVRVTHRTQWHAAAFGIMEPVGFTEQDILSDEAFGPTSAVIVPVLGFDRSCHRLGYGKGFYDRFLAQCTAPTIGIAYEQQLVRQLPAEPHDRALTCVVTEQRVYVPA